MCSLSLPKSTHKHTKDTHTPGRKGSRENVCACAVLRAITRIFAISRKFNTLRVNGRSARSGGITRDFAHAPLAPIHYAVARVRELASY